MRRAIVLATTLAAFAAAPLALAGRSPAGPSVFIVDNAFVRDVQRPVVTVAAGRTVTWHWRSRQSHSVSVRSGPERFATRTRNHGTFAHRFTRAGTYRIECSLHAPGMKMTVVVHR
jgi:plastocyanin